jgi:hypothetical protein
MSDQKLSGVGVAVGAVIGGLGVMVPVAFISGLSLGRSLRPPVAPPPPPACVLQMQQPEKVKLSLRTDPPGADVYFVDGSRAKGKTPLDLEVTRGEPSFDVKVVLVGYQSQVLNLITNLDRDYVVALTPDSKHRHEDCDDSDIKFLAPRF